MKQANVAVCAANVEDFWAWVRAQPGTPLCRHSSLTADFGSWRALYVNRREHAAGMEFAEIATTERFNDPELLAYLKPMVR